MQAEFLPYRDRSRPNILVFDSGVGGLTITREIVSLLPGCNITFAADNAAFPYGTKTAAELIQRVDQALSKLQKLTQADIIVLACNSASTLALPKLRQTFTVPVVGVVPAIKPAAALSQTKTLGLLATPGTVARQYTDHLIKDFAEHCSIIRVGSNKLVELAERKLRGEIIDSAELAREIRPFDQLLAPNLDTVVLACTHFPLLRTELANCLPAVQHWVDSGEAVANRVKELLASRIAPPTSAAINAEQCGTYQSLFTAERPALASLHRHIDSWFSSHFSLAAV